MTLAQKTKHITEANDNYISEDSKSNMVTKTVHAVTGAFSLFKHYQFRTSLIYNLFLFSIYDHFVIIIDLCCFI